MKKFIQAALEKVLLFVLHSLNFRINRDGLLRRIITYSTCIEVKIAKNLDIELSSYVLALKELV